MSYTLLRTQTLEDYYSNTFYCLHIFKWILNLSTWGSIICYIILIKQNSDKVYIALLILIFSYFLFLVIEILFCLTCQLICSKSDKKFDQVISDFKEGIPNIIFMKAKQVINARRIRSVKFTFFSAGILVEILF